MSELSITQYLNADAVSRNIEQTLGSKSAQFIASVSALVNSSEKLAECDRKSLLAACLTAASLDLPINQSLGFAWIIPYKDNTKGITLAQFQAGWRAFVQLAQRSGQYRTINATDVREGEVKSINQLTGELEFEAAPNRESLKIVGYAAYFKLNSGFEKTLYMSKEELESHANKYSQSYRNKQSKTNMWRDDFSAMAKKTVIKLLISRFGPMNVDMQKLVVEDQRSNESYPDNKKETAEEIAKEKERSRIADHIESAADISELEQVSKLVDNYELTELYNNKKKELKKEDNGK